MQRCAIHDAARHGYHESLDVSDLDMLSADDLLDGVVDIDRLGDDALLAGLELDAGGITDAESQHLQMPSGVADDMLVDVGVEGIEPNIPSSQVIAPTKSDRGGYTHGVRGGQRNHGRASTWR